MYKQNGKVWLPSTERYHFAFEDHFSILSPHFVLHCLFLPTFAYKLNCLSTPYLKTYCKTFSFSGLVFTGMAAYLNWRRCFCRHREQNMCSWPKTKRGWPSHVLIVFYGAMLLNINVKIPIILAKEKCRMLARYHINRVIDSVLILYCMCTCYIFFLSHPYSIQYLQNQIFKIYKWLF